MLDIRAQAHYIILNKGIKGAKKPPLDEAPDGTAGGGTAPNLQGLHGGLYSPGIGPGGPASEDMS